MKRSTLIERMLDKNIHEEESFVADMEKPLARVMTRVLVNNPVIMKALAAAFGEELTPEEIDRAQRQLPELLELGEQRQTEKEAESVEGPATE